MKRKDRLFDLDISEMADFKFDERVVSVFPDMINRSVPGYAMIVPMIGLLARRHAQAGSDLYDLGCSLGAVSLAMRAAVRTDGARIFAVDNSVEMIRCLREILVSSEEDGDIPIIPLHQNVLDTRIENASVVVLNFTLQFIEPSARPALLADIAAGLKPGGILVLSEKVRFENGAEQHMQTAWHHDFKKAQGYSELEISRKREALENVMKPDSAERHRARLGEAGFDRVYQWFQGFNFISLVAFR